MKSLLPLVALSLTLLSVSMPVVGQQEMQRGRDFSKGQSHAEMQRSFLRRGEQPRADGKSDQSVSREPATLAHPEELKPAPVQGFVPVQGRERLSPEERKQLRRDINAAGRDIYRRHRPD